jgi:hypothetical protein
MCIRRRQLDVRKMGNRNLIGMEVCAYRKIPALLAHQDEQVPLAQDEVEVLKLKIHMDYFRDELEVAQYLNLGLLEFGVLKKMGYFQVG